MKVTLTRTGPCGALALLMTLSACSDKLDEPVGSGSPVLTTEAAGASIALRAVSVTRRSTSADELKGKGAALLRLFRGGSQVSKADVGAAAVSQTSTVMGARGIPYVRVDYEAQSDTLLAFDTELSRVRDGVEISEPVAKKRFEDVARALMAAKLVVETEYALADARVSRLMQGIGSSSGGPPVESVKEYRFFVPRKVNGIVLNDGGQADLGLTVMIHRSGGLSGIRVSGSDVGVSLGGGVTERADVGELDRRVEADFMSSDIEPLGLRYSLGAPGGEPRRAYRVSRRTLVDGEVVHSRAKTVYYSVTDALRPPDIWPTPDPGETSARPKSP